MRFVSLPPPPQQREEGGQNHCDFNGALPRPSSVLIRAIPHVITLLSGPRAGERSSQSCQIVRTGESVLYDCLSLADPAAYRRIFFFVMAAETIPAITAPMGDAVSLA